MASSVGRVFMWIFGSLSLMLLGVVVWNILIPLVTTNFSKNCKMSAGELIGKRLSTWECLQTELHTDTVKCMGGIKNWDSDQENFIKKIFQAGVREMSTCTLTQAIQVANAVIKETMNNYGFYKVLAAMIDDVDNNLTPNDEVSVFIHTAFTRHIKDICYAE
jgi:hypothetical protein